MKKIKNQRQKQQWTLNIWIIVGFFALLAISAPWFDITVANHRFVKAYTAGIGSTLIFLLILWYKRNNTSITLTLNPIKIAALGLFAMATLSIFWSVNIDFFIEKWLLLLSAVFGFVALSNIEIKQENLIKFAWGLVIGGAIISVIGILQFLFDPFSLPQAATPSSTFGNKNMATQPLVLIFPLSLFLLFCQKIERAKAWFLSLSIASILIFVFYTTTRSAWISIAVELVLIAFYLALNKQKLKQWISWNKDKRNAGIFAALLTLTMINFSADGFTPAWQLASSTVNQIQTNAEDKSNSRYLLWQAATKMITDSPIIGTGLGSWYENVSNRGYNTWHVKIYQNVHNDLLELGVELGLIGLGLFLLLIIALNIAIIKILKNTQQQLRWFYYLVWVSLVGSFINMQFSFPYQLGVPTLLFGWFLALVSKQYDSFSAPIKSISVQLNGFTKSALSGFYLLLCGLVIAVYLQWINVYAQLNKIDANKDYKQLPTLRTIITHVDTLQMFNLLAQDYFKIKDYRSSLLLDKEILDYWTEHGPSLFRTGNALKNKKLYSEALKIAKKMKKINPEGQYSGYLLEMAIYSESKNLQKIPPVFNDLLTHPEQLLGIEDDVYRLLLLNSLKVDSLKHHAPYLYQQYVKYHGYLCEVENNIAIAYFWQEDFKQSAVHIRKILAKEPECANPLVIKKLQEEKAL
ncbi:O-antigen polymerase [uncultured Candidatus Thioglobus sp.]|nr:O-antigen polymerase [uncultured Candidatus Thioglobus sp.]